MEIKVREVTDVEEKSTQQVEQELLDKHEEQFVDSKAEVTETPKVDVEAEVETPVRFNFFKIQLNYSHSHFMTGGLCAA